MEAPEKFHVLIVHNYYQIPGGEDEVVRNEARVLEENGHKVFFYTRDNRETKRYTFAGKLLAPITAIWNFRTYFEIKKIIKEKSIDLVHVHNTWFLVSPSVYYGAQRCGVPVVQTIHNFRLLCPAATFYRDQHICEDCVRHNLWSAFRHKCYRNSRLQTLICIIALKIHRTSRIYSRLHYICLTEFNKSRLLQLKQIPKERVFVKPNFVFCRHRIYPYSCRKHQVIFAGRLDRIKGIEQLLDAWMLLGADAPLLKIYGTGPMEEWCREAIAGRHSIRVQLMGYLPHEQLMDEIALSKALILPTQWYEGFPMSLVEAYSVGTPVLGSAIGNVGNLIQEGITGWTFHPESKEEIAAAVGKLRDITASVLQVYKERYRRQDNYEHLYQIYRTVSESRKNENRNFVD